MKQQVAQLAEKTLLGALQGAHFALRARGFRWEVQQTGDLKIGLWRKKFRDKPKKQAHPRRFVLIPGFGDTPLSWLAVISLIESSLRSQFDEIVLLDFPGYNGRLMNESFCSSLDFLMDAVFDTLDSVKPHTVVGHSLGGFLAAHYSAACSSGKRFNGKTENFRDLHNVVVIDPSGYFESDDEREEWRNKLHGIIRDGARFWRPFLFNREPFWFKWLASPFLKFISNKDVSEFLLSVKVEQEIRHVLPEIKTRMTLVWGEKDSLLPPVLASGWLKMLDKTPEPAWAVIIRNCGHNPQLEAPLKTAHALKKILGREKPVNKRWFALIQ